MSSVFVQRGFSRLPGLASSRLPRAQCGLFSMSMYGSQTEPLSYVRQQTLDEYATKVRKPVVLDLRITIDISNPLGMVVFVHSSPLMGSKAHPGTTTKDDIWFLIFYIYVFIFQSSIRLTPYQMLYAGKFKDGSHLIVS